MKEAYPTIFAIGILTGLLWLGWISPSTDEVHTVRGKGLPRIVVLNAGLAVLVAGLVGARAAFAAAHWPYYAGHPAEILWFWQGGLNWAGGALGGFLGLLLFATVSRRPFWRLADAMAMPMVIVAFASWVGCLLSGCAYGYQLSGPWLTPPTLDMFGALASRWPTQAVGAVFCIGLMLTLVFTREREMTPGLRASLTLALLAAAMMALSLLRADPVGLVASIRLDFWGSSAILILALAGIASRAIWGRKEG